MFTNRSNLGKTFENKMDTILSKYMDVINTSYENLVENYDVRQKIRYLYHIPEVIYLRFHPDRLISTKQSNKFMFIDYKVCNAQTHDQWKIDLIRKQSGDFTLSEKNIAMVEYTAIRHYKQLAEKLNLNVALVIYSRFYEKKLIAEKVNNVKVKYQGKIEKSISASGTPYANINLDEFRTILTFFQEEFMIHIDEKEINEVINYMDNIVY